MADAQDRPEDSDRSQDPDWLLRARRAGLSASPPFPHRFAAREASQGEPEGHSATNPGPPQDAHQPRERLVGRGTGARLWLVRHAEVHEDWQGIAYGQLDVPLSQAGLERSAHAGRAFGGLPPTRLISSDLQRAQAMADAIASASGVSIELDPALRELDRGRWQGRRVSELREQCADEVAQFYADPWNWSGHGGECDARLFARVRQPFESALADSSAEAQTLVFCTHYNVIRVTVGRALGIPPERTFALRLDPGRAVLLEDARAGWVLHRSNVEGPASEEDATDPTHPGHLAHSAGAPIARPERGHEQ